jgi:hypothetical protein
MHGDKVDWTDRTVIVPAVYREWHGKAPPAWLSAQYPVYLYQRENASLPCMCPNRGYESGVYFTFIAQLYNQLPAFTAFIQADWIFLTKTNGGHGFQFWQPRCCEQGAGRPWSDYMPLGGRRSVWPPRCVFRSTAVYAKWVGRRNGALVEACLRELLRVLGVPVAVALPVGVPVGVGGADAVDESGGVGVVEAVGVVVGDALGNAPTERVAVGVAEDVDERLAVVVPESVPDGVCDEVDNCVNTPNADQTDANNNGIGDACEVCCDFPVGDPIASTDQACSQGGGIAVADVLCVDVVCCAGAQGQVLPYLISAAECERAGGREIDEAICCDEELCCRLPNGAAVTTNHADCVAQQGAPVPDEVCESEMCCALPDGTYSYVSAEECGDNGGGQALRAALALGNAPLWGDLCLEVCCHQADGTYATQVAGVCRDAGGMMAADPSFCEAPVCCVTADSASFVSAFECEQAGGNAMNEALCANVCCQGIAGQPVYATAFACNGAGGVSVEDSLCSAEVCCTLPDGTSATLSVSDCEQKGGLQVDQSCCEEQEICCALPDGTTENLVPSQCAARDGLETDPSCCVAVCCVLEDGTATSLSIETCAARGGRVDDTGAACEPVVVEEVCCALPDNTTATLPSDVCAERGGMVTAAEKCEPAAQVCCQRTDGTATLTDAASCVGEGLSVVANELCEAQVCCRVDGHLEWLAPRVCFCKPSLVSFLFLLSVWTVATFGSAAASGAACGDMLTRLRAQQVELTTQLAALTTKVRD